MGSAEKEKLRSEIADAINNVDNMTDEEIVIAYKKIDAELQKMTLGESGKFAWESGLEVLTMIYLGIEYKKNKEKYSQGETAPPLHVAR